MGAGCSSDQADTVKSNHNTPYRNARTDLQETPLRTENKSNAVREPANETYSAEKTTKTGKIFVHRFAYLHVFVMIKQNDHRRR